MGIDTIIGSSAAILGIISFLPQVLQVIRTKHTKDISLTMFVLFCISVSFWTTYGILKKDLIIIITNITILLQSLIILGYKLKYK